MAAHPVARKYVVQCICLIFAGTFLTPQDGLYKLEVQGSVEHTNVQMTLNRIPSRQDVQ